MPRNFRQDIVLAYGELLDCLGAFMDHAEHILPKDRYQALEGTGKKVILAIEGQMKQTGYLLDQFERLSGQRLSKPPDPRSPSRVVVPFRRPQ